MKRDDCVTTIVFDRKRINLHRGTPTADKLARVGHIQLRFTRLLLPNGEYEYLASNLTLEEFSVQEIGDLYRMRWGIETAFDDLKNKLHIENFTGTKPILLEQDIYATSYLCNIVNGIIHEAQLELEKEKTTHRKHEMAINKNIAIGIVKEELLHILMDTNELRRKHRMNNLINEIKSNLLPIRKDRHYPRKKGNFAGKFSNTRKRSF